MLHEDVANNGRERISHSHAIFLLEELVVNLKIGGSQTDFQQLHDGFDLQDRLFRHCDIVVDFSLFTNVPVDEVLKIIENKLHDDVTLTERSVLQVEAIMELLEVCLRTTYFQVDDKFFQQKDGMAMGNSLSPIVSNIFMEHFEKLALDSAPYKPSLWLRYVDDTFVVWPHGPERLQTFFDHLNSLRPSICFTMETESNNAI
ncbi:uncharacterized protein LOC111865964 [Cryptotermes secundus]|uniref:uncharacterized protein LOC111865964 n=1 Tax=Cryptotermes secundus TaxID=105785 RepID=UPI000CD7CB36|nr:uncharacterized protein LOC111865964 [Cryptotermes secundus]